MTEAIARLRGILPQALALLASATLVGCASSGAVPRPFPGAAAPPVAAPPAPAVPAPVEAGVPAPVPPAAVEAAPALVATALTYRGVPYRNGGSDPSGFDCSGFVQWVFAQHGTGLPREVREQYQAGRKIDRDEVRPGDLVFFETVHSGASHVGIAIGNDQFVHAPSSRGVVRIERYTSQYWNSRYVGARRIEPAVSVSK